MRWLAVIGVVALLSVGLVGGAGAAAPDGTTPAAALPMAATITGSITGSSGGSYVYYAFDHPGDGSADSVVLTYSPLDRSTGNGIGVKLWQAGKQIGATNGLSNKPGTATLAFSTKTKGQVLVQVYSYLARPVNYQLQLVGVPGFDQPVAAPVAPATPVAPAAAGATPAAALPMAATITGSITGSSGGSYVYYAFDHPGDGSADSVVLTYSPLDRSTGNGIGVKLWQAGKQIGATNGLSNKPGTATLAFSTSTKGQILIQVYSYLARPVNYQLQLVGVPGIQ